MSLKSLIWFVLLGFLALAGATAASVPAQAQGQIGGQSISHMHAMANCTSIEACGLTAASVAEQPSAGADGIHWTSTNLQYGSVDDVAPEAGSALPQRAGALDEPLVLAVGASPKSALYTQLNEIFVDDTDFAEDGLSNTLSVYSLSGVNPDTDAFSYNFNRRWRFMADQLDDNSVALQAIAAGKKTDPEDLLWHLSHSDFSVKMGIVRRF